MPVERAPDVLSIEDVPEVVVVDVLVADQIGDRAMNDTAPDAELLAFE